MAEEYNEADEFDVMEVVATVERKSTFARTQRQALDSGSSS